MDAMTLIWIVEIGGFCLVVLGIAALVEGIPALSRWLEYRRLRRALRRGRSIKEIKAMARAVK